MVDSFTLRCLFLTIPLVGAVLVVTNWLLPALAALPDVDAVLRSAVAATSARYWWRDFTTVQLRLSEEARQPIDPTDFHEALLAAAIFQETNQQRTDLKLPAFLPDEKASQAARLHSLWMASAHALSHDEPSTQGPAVAALDRLEQQGLSHPHATAENIAFNFVLELVPRRAIYGRLENGRKVYSYRPGGAPLTAYNYATFAQTILAQWMHSPRHRAHIVDPGLRSLGVGTALAHRPGHPDAIYATQDFYTPRAPAPAADTNPTEATLLPRRP